MKKFFIILLFLLLQTSNCLAKPNPLFPFKFPDPAPTYDSIHLDFYFFERTVHKRHLLVEFVIPF